MKKPQPQALSTAPRWRLALVATALLSLVVLPTEAFFLGTPTTSSRQKSLGSRYTQPQPASTITHPPRRALPAAPTFSSTSALASARSTTGFGDARGRGPRDDQGRIELLCKAGPDGAALGDCPFCHYVQMVLRYKGLRYRLVPLAPDDKPEWLIEGYGGKMPCLVHDEEAYTDSGTITQYLEYFFPGEQPLTLDEDDPALDEEIKAATSGVFGAFARYIKNLEKADDPPLQAALWAELGKVDALLQKTGGPYLAGDRITLDDMALAPKLYHVKVAVAQFKNVIVPPSLKALAAYMRHMSDLSIFQESSYPPDIITWGWGNARRVG